MKVKKLFKYETGEVIPEDAVYLSTQVETTEEQVWNEEHTIMLYKKTYNTYVWHYFLVETGE